MTERAKMFVGLTAFCLGVYVFYEYVLPLWTAIKAALELSE